MKFFEVYANSSSWQLRRASKSEIVIWYPSSSIFFLFLSRLVDIWWQPDLYYRNYIRHQIFKPSGVVEILRQKYIWPPYRQLLSPYSHILSKWEESTHYKMTHQLLSTKHLNDHRANEFYI
jgi:hypothetical protein